MVRLDEAGVSSVEEESEGAETEAFAGVAAVGTGAGLICASGGFSGDGLEREGRGGYDRVRVEVQGGNEGSDEWVCRG